MTRDEENLFVRQRVRVAAEQFPAPRDGDSSIDHEEWFRGEVEKGRASAREGRLLEHDDVVARMDQRYRG